MNSAAEDSEPEIQAADEESEAPPVAGSPLSKPPAGLATLSDSSLAAELERLSGGAGEVLLAANAYTVCLWHRESGSTWQQVCCGEFGEEAKRVATTALRRRLLWHRTTLPPWGLDSATLSGDVATAPVLTQWIKDATGTTSGREGDVTAAIKEELLYLAGWRCQFAGCGRDLHRHQATGKRGRFSYFAHIVAASPDGPRGHPTLSRELASKLSNFMLLCDECHRMIDKIRPASYPAELLQQMRENNIAEVQRLLDSLAYKPAEIVAVVGNIAGQSGQFDMDDAHEALRGIGLRSNQAKPERYFNLGGQHHDVHSDAYWSSLFQTLKRDIPILQDLLDGTRSGAARPRIGLFPMHSTSVLVLAGRVLGDTAGLHIFQPHRNQVGSGHRWAWPKAAVPPAADKYRARVRWAHSSGQTEAILMVLLTADIAVDRLPNTCANSGELLLPTIEVVGSAYEKDCIGTPEDLQLLGKAIDDAVRTLQDEWRVQTVHLFVSAPASAAVLVGQKMQARHHANYVLYESLRGPGAPYQATIEISAVQVRELVSGFGSFLPLQS